jgi:hypothetical protein
MSMFNVTGKVLNVYQRERTDKETGKVEVTPKVQLLGEMPVPGGDTRYEMVDLTCESQADFKSFMGKTVSVALGIFSPAKGQIVYFIPKGARPVEVAA